MESNIEKSYQEGREQGWKDKDAWLNRKIKRLKELINPINWKIVDKVFGGQ